MLSNNIKTNLNHYPSTINEELIIASNLDKPLPLT